MILINGEYKEHIEVVDRGFQYGDGLFETIEVNNGQPIFLDRHLDRLKAGCNRLYIPFPNNELLITETKELCKHSTTAVLKLIITRGSGGRGYRQPDIILPNRVLSLHAFPDYPAAYKEQGVTARFCATRLGLNPALAGLKHLNRLEQVLARAEWNNPAVQEGIMMDMNDHVIEGTMTNLFYIKKGSLYTSSLVQSGVAGIMRSIIMTLSSEHHLPAMECSFSKDVLLSADEVFLSNSIIGIWPVNQIANTSYQVGPITRHIQRWLDNFKNEALRM
ncbi:Aminodeoxychorismate lyase [Candidatus Methylobacter favarea]|uniref:Aminodeoxychorismate lyase n=1 Tax=Candidatus Methylobacter favarea TaxID=2707345 RepID=A0A8S0WHW3_9GAMM|nr:aminodeoxychorismate lyase [Candidatus Methylobacter favarea]CAA9890121.1 Aminodeoxychorismate lyase [Candidatus Methylobacter favarea]